MGCSVGTDLGCGAGGTIAADSGIGGVTSPMDWASAFIIAPVAMTGGSWRAGCGDAVRVICEPRAARL